MSTPISKNNFSKTARESRVECKREYKKKIKKEQEAYLADSQLQSPFSCSSAPFHPSQSKESPPPFLLSRIYVSLPKRTPQICWRKIPSFLPFLISFLSYFLPFYNRFSHGNNICAILLKTKSPIFFQNSVDFPSKQMTARFLMPKKPRNMIQKTSNKIK